MPVTVTAGERELGVDTGFIVYNRRTYPLFTRLLETHAAAPKLDWFQGLIVAASRTGDPAVADAAASVGASLVDHLLVPVRAGFVVTTTDLRREVMEETSANVSANGAVTVPAHILHDIVRKLRASFNVLGPMRVTQALLPNLSAGDRKTVVNISSRLGSLAQNDSGGLYGYRESKVALNMFTVSLANEFRDEGFIVVAMNPGWVQTDMGGENAMLTPEQSVSGMRSVIEGLTLDDTGTFRAHSGGQEPW